MEPYRASAVVSPATDPGTPEAEMSDLALVGEMTLRVEEHVASGRERRDLAIVERERPAIAQPNEHVAAAAQVTGLRVRYCEREARGDGRVHRIAALAQDRETGVARERAVARNHRMRRHRGVLRCRERPSLGERNACRVGDRLGSLEGVHRGGCVGERGGHGCTRRALRRVAGDEGGSRGDRDHTDRALCNM